MSWYKQTQTVDLKDSLQRFLEKQEIFEKNRGRDFTDYDRKDRTDIYHNMHRTLVKEEQQKEERVITLYRNFDANLDKVQKDENGNFIFSPKKCESGVLWFAHDLQGGEKEKYYNRGKKYLLTYPLPVTYHYISKTYSDGSVSQTPLNNNVLEDSSTGSGYTLPDGFLFSNKVQKHIICNKILKVPPSYVTEFKNELS